MKVKSIVFSGALLCGRGRGFALPLSSALDRDRAIGPAAGVAAG